ncbi:AMP-binding protein [Hydrogenimonas thermophila]|uniref:AMP-binding protein n=1 Tax=Hydrogenimonas thermophila TaxID=223786 RepID=UPI0029373DEA|nr:AMP-binding protein [Hydrogenimonas thermophila]WOE69622.1 AMP-binding protein [Hydrogenimonas thermophila]WOE72136.1 AMP-binding protein [Hydrogenimonas thermophila]
MKVTYIHTDNSRETFSIFTKSSRVSSSDWLHINLPDKKSFIQTFFEKFLSDDRIVLFDPRHKQLLEYYSSINISQLPGANSLSEDCHLLFFTSGSTGFPVGAFKTKENLLSEVKALAKLVEKSNIQKVVVTVPFVHIYGILAGLLLPHYIDATLVIKEDFLPYELLNESKEQNTLVITTPIFIKALNRLGEKSNLSKTIFISSTGPLNPDDADMFEKKYETTLLQLFGSTETGGIAYKFGSAKEWQALDNVSLSSYEEKLQVSSPYISPFILNQKILPVSKPFTTEDIVEIDGNSFNLIGRSNKIIKIAGKRISALQLESIIETIPGVKKALVSVVYKKEQFRSEQIVITLESSEKISKQTIRKKLSENYGVLTIPFEVNYVDKITISAMGKKVLIQ